MKNKASSGAGPSQRQLRVGELVRHALSDILARGDLPDPALAKVLITVPEVRMSPDLKVATVLVMPLGGLNVETSLAALDNARGRLKGLIGRKAGLRFAPDLRFRLDTRYEDDIRVDSLLHEPEVARDLSPKTDDEDEGEAR